MLRVETLSNDDLKDLFLNHSGYPTITDEGVAIGNTPPYDMPEASLEFISFLVDEMEQRVRLTIPFTPEYAHCMDHRLITYEEFEKLFAESIDESEYIYHRAYDFYMIKTYGEKIDLLSGITRDYQGYMKLLRKSEASPLRFFFTPVEMKLPKDGLQRHMHILAKTGQGKSNLIKLVAHEIQKEDKKQSLVLIEPHGDLAQEVRDFGLNVIDPDRLIYVDPYYQKGLIPVINPFDIGDLSDENIDLYSQELSKVFVELLKEGTSLSSQMDAVLRPALSTLLRMKHSTLEDLQDLMDYEDEEKRAGIVAKGLQNPYPPHRKMFAKVWGGQEISTGYKSTLNSIYNKIQNLLNTAVFRNLTCGNDGRSTIDLETEVNAGKVIIFNLSKGKMGAEASQAYGKFIASMLQTIAFKRADTYEQDRIPTYLIIDEFQNYVTDSVKVILGEARKYGMHLILSHQSIGQITNTEIRDTLLGNTGIKAVGISSKKTLRAMAEEMDITLKEFQELQPFEFYINAQSPKTGIKAKPYRVKPPAHLAKWSTRYYQDKEERKAIREYQVGKYYAPIGGATDKQTWQKKEDDIPPENPTGNKPKFSL